MAVRLPKAVRGKAATPAVPATKSEFLVPADSGQLLPWLNRKLDTGKYRMPDYQMKLNLAYMLGQQWIVWDQSRRTFVRPVNRADDPNAPVRVTVNKIGGIAERWISRLLKSAPEPECRPVSDDDSDVGAAKVSTRILSHEMQRLGWEEKLVNLYFWTVPLGWGYVHVAWNPTEGKTLGSSEDNMGELHEGEVTLDVVPAFELAVDPNASSMEDARWAVRTLSMTREAVWEKWGVTPTGDDGGSSLVDDVYALTSPSFRPGDSKRDTVKVHQLWLLPGRAKAEGMVVTWTGNQILVAPKPFPYEHGKLPFVQVDLLPGIGTREGRTWVTDLVPLQADYNDARSREATIRRTLVPKFVAAAGSIDPKSIGTRVDVLLYNPVGDRPQLMIPDSGWMSQYEAAMGRADAEMGDRAGQSDVSGGKASASMPAAAILALQEADDTKLAISAKGLAGAISRIGWQILELVRQYWMEDRIVRTWSDSGELEVYQFSGADIAEQLDVHVESESSLPRSKSARVQLAMDLLALGPPGTPASPFGDMRDFLRVIDLPGVDFMIESLNVDTQQAHRENGDLVRGKDCQVHTWDNHEAHITEHDKFRKSDDYNKIEEASLAGDATATKVKAVIDAHVMNHYGLLQQQANAAAGPPPGAPGPSSSGPGPGGPPPRRVGVGQYLDAQTGLPPDPVMVASGQAPSAIAHSAIGTRMGISRPKVPRNRSGIGGPGNPGRVSGTTQDEQAARMGN